MSMCVRGRKCEWWPFLKDLQRSNPHHAVWILVCLIAAERVAYACVSVRMLCVGFLISGKSLNPGLQGKHTHTHTHLGMLWNHIIVRQDVHKRTRSPSQMLYAGHRCVCVAQLHYLITHLGRWHIVTWTNTNPTAVCCNSQLRGEWKEFVNQSNIKPFSSKGGFLICKERWKHSGLDFKITFTWG